jgi:hypothetical protein
VIPDVDVALGDVSADSGHDVGCLECVGRGGQQSYCHAVVGANRRYSHGGDDAAALFRGRIDLGLSEGMAPHAERHAAADEQRGNEEHSEGFLAGAGSDRRRRRRITADRHNAGAVRLRHGLENVHATSSGKTQDTTYEGVLACEQPVNRRPADLERLGDVDRPHALRL